MCAGCGGKEGEEGGAGGGGAGLLRGWEKESEGEDNAHRALDVVAKRARRVVGLDMARWKFFFPSSLVFLFASFLCCACVERSSWKR